jgi:hypothetical protein
VPLTRLVSLPLYPAVLAGAIVFGAYIDEDISLHAALRPLLVVITVSAVLTALSAWAFGSRRGPALVAAAILMVRSTDLFHAAVAVVLLVLVAVAWFVARRSLLRDPNRLFNIFSVALVAATLLTSAISGTLWRIDLEQGRPFPSGTASAETGRADRPDIYVILLDGYPRRDTLDRLFGFDNTPFLVELRNRGFEVADSSRSNYMYTTMTLASTLHMEYVHDIPRSSLTSPSRPSLRTLINRNPTWERLRSLGYQIAANQAPWETVAMRSADLFCGNHINDFEMYLLRTTLIGPVVNFVNPDFLGDQHRRAITQAFDCLSAISGPTASPKSVFIHVGGPHLPVVFTSSGEPAGRDLMGQNAQELGVSQERFVSAYGEEIEYLNRRVLEVVDALASRPDEPIVIIMSDHGSEARLDWADSSKSDLQERFSNFFAARTPSKPSVFPADMTPINLFPLLFNTYFDAAIPLHDARFFLSPIHNKLEFTEIPDPAPPDRGQTALTSRAAPPSIGR